MGSQTAARLLRIYGIAAPAGDNSLPPPYGASAPIPVTIDGVVEPGCGPCIRLKLGNRRSSHACPLDEFGAEDLVAVFDGAELHDVDSDVHRTLVQLLTKCSKFYCDCGLREFHLLLYLTPQGYRTHAVYMLRPRTVAGRPRM